MYANNNKKKEAKKYNGSDNEITKLDSKNRTEVDAIIEEVKRELRSLFVKTGGQIKKLGNALKKVVREEESICEEIKNALKEEIAEGVISTRTIELHCPPEWKRKTKPKQRENEKISFSKVEEKTQEQQVAVTQDGKSVIINEIPSNTDTVSSDVINRLHEESNQNGFAQSKEESSITPSLNASTAFPIKQQTKVLTDTKNQVLFHISLCLSHPYKETWQLCLKQPREQVTSSGDNEGIDNDV